MSPAPKIDELRCFANDTKPDLISLSETWLNDVVTKHHLNIPGFNLVLKKPHFWCTWRCRAVHKELHKV